MSSRSSRRKSLKVIFFLLQISRFLDFKIVIKVKQTLGVWKWWGLEKITFPHWLDQCLNLPIQKPENDQILNWRGWDWLQGLLSGTESISNGALPQLFQHSHSQQHTPKIIKWFLFDFKMWFVLFVKRVLDVWYQHWCVSAKNQRFAYKYKNHFLKLLWQSFSEITLRQCSAKDL